MLDYSRKMPYQNLALNEIICSLQAGIMPNAEDVGTLIFYLTELRSLWRDEK